MTDTGVDASTAAIMSYTSGSIALINSSMTMAGTVSAAVHGTLGRIEISKSFHEQASFRVFDNNQSLIKSYDEKMLGRGMQYQAIHLEDCLTKGLLESPIMSLSDTVKIMQVMEQIHIF